MMTLYVAALVLCIMSRQLRKNKHETHVLKTRFAQQSWDLSSYDVNGRAGHEPAHGGCRNEFHDPTQAKKTNGKDNETANECDSGSNLGAGPYVWMVGIYVIDDL